MYEVHERAYQKCCNTWLDSGEKVFQIDNLSALRLPRNALIAANRKDFLRARVNLFTCAAGKAIVSVNLERQEVNCV